MLDDTYEMRGQVETPQELLPFQAVFEDPESFVSIDTQ